MPVATITFNLPEEQEEYKTTMKAGAMHSCLWDISQEVFRPARKHGYPSSGINRLVEYLDSLARTAAESEGISSEGTDATHLISLLEKEFYKILEEHEVTI